MWPHSPISRTLPIFNHLLPHQNHQSIILASSHALLHNIDVFSALFIWFKFYSQLSDYSLVDPLDTLSSLSCHCACSAKLQPWLNSTLYVVLKGTSKKTQPNQLIEFMVANLKCSLEAYQWSFHTSLVHWLSLCSGDNFISSLALNHPYLLSHLHDY